ncbi:hypothetical protein FGO68_gene6426 [Halteria grandinella]|uniref:GPS domain-containing protein n=1 Tax=Halteria grandinella TaxID=5974 RepID=A0A8J8NHY8_HALGN|nr:hypothetical protein FGO68_gene6426 [Halteria grandinella]
MMEFLDYDMLTNNVTGHWNKTTQEDYEQQVNRTWDNLNRTLRMIKMVQNSTLYKLSFLQTQIQMTSRKLSYKQVLTTKDKILSMPATDNVKKQQSTFVKISPANFQNTSVALNDEYIAEAIEYSINPFQMGNNDRLATNIIEINLYNQVKTVTTNDITKVEVKDLTIPIEFSFPAFDNQNLTEFLKDYNTLNPFRNVEKLKREKMIIASGLTCVYWDVPTQKWSDHGCILSNIDTTHIKCACKHLSAFTILFQTPKMSVDAPLLENSTSKADAGSTKDLTLDDIVKWPIDKYFENLGELWQHNRPSFLTFILKPGFIVLGLFWAMYLSSLIYYSGRDDIKRYQMTKTSSMKTVSIQQESREGQKRRSYTKSRFSRRKLRYMSNFQKKRRKSTRSAPAGRSLACLLVSVLELTVSIRTP